MDFLEEAVKNVEFFMAMPLPTQVVTVLFADSVVSSYAGQNSGASIAILPEHENNEHSQLPWVIAHEVSHYYWAGNRSWVDEGMANLIEIYTGGRPPGWE